MIKGIGIDLIEIDRVKKASEKRGFIDKYFTKEEIKLFEERGYKSSIIASNFAVKEAVSKVLGTGFVGFGLMHIEVLRDAKGKPFVQLYGKAKELQTSLGITLFHVSISHNKENVIAYVIGEGDPLC
jgi:holo-[acyl-carrier protein] synthase